VDQHTNNFLWLWCFLWVFNVSDAPLTVNGTEAKPENDIDCCVVLCWSCLTDLEQDLEKSTIKDLHNGKQKLECIIRCSGCIHILTYQKETVKSGTRRITPKNLLFRWWVDAVILDGHFLGPTSRAGTLQPDAGLNPHPDAGLNPHPAAWPESLKETKHKPFTLGGIISTGPHA
jgi:hypothetical protein